MTHLYKLPPDPTPPRPQPRKKPEEIGLDLSAEVLRLPIIPAARFVLAEIIALHHHGERGCDASDQHFADRLTISRATASAAVQLLEEKLLITKDVDKAAGFYRVLTPRFIAIAAAAKLNPYPERHRGRPSPKMGLGNPKEATPKIGLGEDESSPEVPTPKMGLGYPENGDSPTPKMGTALPPKLDTNTSSNLSGNFSEPDRDASEPAASLAASVASKKNEGTDSESVANKAAQHVEENAADAELVKPKSKPAAQKKIKPGGAAANLLPADCPLAELLNPGGDAERVQQLEKPLTLAQADALLTEFGFVAVRDILLAMANYKPLLKNSTSVNLTARKWFDRRANDAKPNQHESSSNTSDRGDGSGRREARRYPTNGAKPDDDAAEFARALAQSRRASGSNS